MLLCSGVCGVVSRGASCEVELQQACEEGLMCATAPAGIWGLWCSGQGVSSTGCVLVLQPAGLWTGRGSGWADAWLCCKLGG
jgi:hypothetical protein